MIYVFALVALVMGALGVFGSYEKLRADKWEAKYMAADARRIADSERRLQVSVAEEMKAKERVKHDRVKAAALQSRARDLSPVASVHLSGDAVRLLYDATGFANGVATDAKRDQAEASAFSESAFARYVADAAAAYRDAYGQWLACVQFYEGIR